MRFPPTPEELEQRRPAADQAGQRPRPPRQRRRRPARTPEEKAKASVYNAVAGIFAVGTLIALALFAFLWTNYNSPLNPLAPPTPFPIVVTATYTPTITLTPSPTLAPSATLTLTTAPTLAPSPSFTPLALEGFTTPSAAAPGPEANAPTPEGGFPFVLQRAPLYLTNPAARGGCAWASITGSVMNYEGGAVNGLQVRVVGPGIDATVPSGSTPGNGPGGFEVVIGDSARDGLYVVQLSDAAGVPVSAAVSVPSRADCAQNIAALRFVAALPSPP